MGKLLREYQGQYRALAVKQPWAALIAQGSKTIEVRSWPTHYRGDLLITSSSHRVSKEAYKRLDIPIDTRYEKRGVTICLAELYDVQEMDKEDEKHALVPFLPFYYSWKLRNIRPVKQQKVKNFLKLFDPVLAEPLEYFQKKN